MYAAAIVQKNAMLLTQRRFLALFVVQFLGALNDNIFKNALIIILVFSAANDAAQASLLVNLAAGLFILPFLLFSALAGQIADKYDKTRLTRRIKQVELVIMLFGAWALISGSIVFMLAVLFVMGSQSAFFGPIKYAILPQVLSADELVEANAHVEAATFIAILLGTMLGGILAGAQAAYITVSVVVIVVAIGGLVASYFMPCSGGTGSAIKLSFSPVGESYRLIKTLRTDPAIYSALLAISWFWFLGASYLTQIPVLTEQIIGGDNTVVTALLCAFTVGIAAGSGLCARLSKGAVKLTLVIVGGIGFSVFGGDLYYSIVSYQQQNNTLQNVTAEVFLTDIAALKILCDVVLLGLSGGLYTVPLYSYIQRYSVVDYRARTIAANNILNALFMVLSAIVAIVMLAIVGASLADLLLLLAVLNIVVIVVFYRRTTTM